MVTQLHYSSDSSFDFAHSLPVAESAEEPLVGREPEIARIAGVVRALAAGRGTVLEVAGDAGSGKTRLLSVLAGQARRIGAPVARADLVDRSIHAQLARWVAGNGGVLLLDDAHLCDKASSGLLARLIRAPIPGPFVLALAHRPRRTGAALLEALDHGARTGHVARVEPGPLDEQDVALLLDRRRPGESAPRVPGFAASLREAAGGNPRNVRILAAAGWRPDTWPKSPGPDTGALLREAVALTAELDALPPDAAVASSVGALLGDRFRLEDVAEVSGLGLDRTVRALAELTRRDVLRAADGGGRLSFRHPVLWHVAREHSDFGLRLTTHRRALSMLAGRGASAAAQARHAEHVVSIDSAAGLRPLVDGATAILAEDPATAERWLRLALESLPGEARDPEWAAPALTRCQALTAVGELTRARTLARDVLHASAALPAELRLQAHARCADVERLLGRYPEAEAVAYAALDPLPDPSSAAASELAFQYGLAHVLHGTPAQADALVQAAAHASSREHAPLRVLAAFYDTRLGGRVDLTTELTNCARLVDAMPNAATGYLPEMLTLLGCAELDLERFADAARHLNRALATDGPGTDRRVHTHQLLGLSLHAQRIGQLEDAQRHAREAESLAREIGAAELVGAAMTMRAGARIWAVGRRAADEVVALVRDGARSLATGHGWWTGAVVGQLAETLLLAGDPAACRRTLLKAGAVRTPLLPALSALMSAADLALGDLAEARAQVEAAQLAADALNLPAPSAYAHRARADLLAAEGRQQSAAELFDEAADGFRHAGMPVQHAWTLVSGAGSFAAVFGLRAALDRLDTAVHIAESCGARRVREEAAHAWRALESGDDGAYRPRAGAPRSGVDQLSEREREIAELAASGMRSRQIAERLFLSPRTVDSHLSRVYRKLEVSSRAALSRVIIQPSHASPACTAELA